MIFLKPLTDEQRELMLAIENGNIGLIKKIVKSGCDPNFDTGNAVSSSPLYFSAFKGNVEIVRWLVEEGGVDLDFKKVNYIGQNLARPEIANFLAKKLL